MTESHCVLIADELGIMIQQAKAVESLLNESATIPFIARYRKERTGSCDEVVITKIRDRLTQLAALDNRQEAILKSLEERDLLTNELRNSIESAGNMTALEDIYLPYRPKRHTRVMAAREKGLEPLAIMLFAQETTTDPLKEAINFVSEKKGVESVEDALAGARDIIAEWANENAEARKPMRRLFYQEGILQSNLVKGKESEGIKYSNYFDWHEPVNKVPGHRVLAMFRGEKEGCLKVTIRPPEEKALELLRRCFVKATGAASEQVNMAVEDHYLSGAIIFKDKGSNKNYPRPY
jgi:uncharacterized protein